MLKVIDHPLIKHKLTVMRKKETGTKDFRQNLDEIGGLMVYEITRDLPLNPIEIETPICQYTGYELAKKVVIVPILRAGLGMVNGIQDLIPTAKIAHVGMYRDEETLEPHTYFEKYPKNLEPEGVKTVEEAHPDVDIYLASLDDNLNEHGYIVPGLGDAGDRIFGTK